MALHSAARDGNLQELEKLIAAGQDLNARDKHHRTALVMASWAGKVASAYFSKPEPSKRAKYATTLHSFPADIVNSIVSPL